MTKEPHSLVDSIVIPATFIPLCDDWYGSMDCMLYAVSSTGGLTLGTIRPSGCNTAEQWYLHIWRELSCDVRAAAREADKTDDADNASLVEFAEWISVIVDRLEMAFDLAEWDRGD